MQSLPNGTQLGVYTILRLIARGGMGEVYEAFEEKLQRRVAVKLISPENPDDHDFDELLTRFWTEARNLARINHPNVVTIYDIDTIGEWQFIAMEYIDGVSFKELLNVITFSPDAALPLFEQMTDGIRSLHEIGMIHRDIKPHNLMLAADGRVKLLDFGIAKGEANLELTRVGAVIGTIPYMPPELRNGGSASVQSDLWSLGAIFYECLSGERLSDQKKPSDETSIHFSSESRKRIPKGLRTIIAKLCADKPEERYTNATELLSDLALYRKTRPPLPPEGWAALTTKVRELLDEKRKADEKKNPPAIPPPVTQSTRPSIVSKSIRTSRTSPPPPPKRKKWLSRRMKRRLQTAGLVASSLGFIVSVWMILSSGGPRPLPPPPAPTPITVVPPTQTTPTSAVPTAIPSEPIPTPVHRPPPQKTLPVSIVEPSLGQKLWLEPGRIPTLSWSRALNADEYEIQIATDAAFTKVIIQEAVAGTRFRPERVLEEGTFYWRLLPRAKTSPLVEPGYFSVISLAPVELTEPESGFREEVKNESSHTSIQLSWQCKPGQSLYRAQVSRDTEFNNLVYNTTIKGCAARIPRVGVGNYWWRVRIEGAPESQELWSDYGDFVVEAKPPPNRPVKQVALGKPVASKADQTIILQFQKTPRNVASLPQTVAVVPKLKWTGVPGATHYLVQISRTANFKKPIADLRATTNSIDWSDVRPGHFYWRVAADSRKAKQGPFSEKAKLTVYLPPPVLDGAYKYVIDPKQNLSSLQLEWQSTPLAEKYIVQMSPRRDMASAQTRVTSLPKMSLTDAPKKFFVKVAAADASGETISPYSSVAPVEIETSFPLEAPRIVSPTKGARAPLRGGKLSVIFSWAPTSGAQAYQVELATDEQFKNTLKKHVTREVTFILKGAELKGRIFWRIRAKGQAGLSDWSPVSYFDLIGE